MGSRGAVGMNRFTMDKEKQGQVMVVDGKNFWRDDKKKEDGFANGNGLALLKRDQRSSSVVDDEDFVRREEQLRMWQGVFPSEEEIWCSIREEAGRDSASEPMLAPFLHSTILSHNSLFDSLAYHLANKLASPMLIATQLITILSSVFASDRRIRLAVRADLIAVKMRDPACRGYSQPLLYFKGFQAIQSYRVAHVLWQHGRHKLALAMQSLISDTFHVDIHPAAKLGMGIMFDHAIGIVIGETAVVGDNVSFLHNVTLGGNGKETGDRHPKVGNGALFGAHVTVLGNITIGECAKIGAGSVVLQPVPAYATAVGVPAKVVSRKDPPVVHPIAPHEKVSFDAIFSQPAWTMDHITPFNDYVPDFSI
mmetsp:Transcript_13333/g.21872  ORF Transcript_13333/g.21872 Transcript_13333/m.21872 type:complete len:366 (-) Transcript_13333:558-1655(-)